MKPRGLLTLLLLLAVGIGTWYYLGHRPGSAPDPTLVVPDAGASDPPKAAPADPRVPFSPIPADLASRFSGEKAYAHVKALCEIGPRPPASPGYEQALRYLDREFVKQGWLAHRQKFQATTPKGPMEFTNLIVRYASGPSDQNESTPIVIGGHFDTKTMPYPFVGANDSGSSTGVILELARVLGTEPKVAASVEFVLFDGEEAILEHMNEIDGLYGSKYYAKSISTRRTWPALGIVLDLVGDRNLPFYYNYSDHAQKRRSSFINAAEAAAREFSLQLVRSPGNIADDHVPLQNTGLPCFHLIGDFMSMPYWHQPGDTLEVVSPEALEKSGKVTLRFLSSQL